MFYLLQSSIADSQAKGTAEQKLNSLLFKALMFHEKLIVEQQLFSEAQVTASLTSIAQELKLAQLQPCMQLAQYFTQDDIKVNGEILLNQLQQATYHYLLSGFTESSDHFYKIINQVLAIVIRVKP